MSQYLTLDKNSPEFEAHLRGTFSRDHRALPVKSLNINSEQEKVTFQILPISEIARPSWLTVWMKALRPRSFLTILFPMFFILSKNILDNSLQDVGSMIFATLGVIFLFSAFNLRNDFVDHMKGFDRVDALLGSRPIQAGWLSAESVRRVAQIFLILSLLMALPVFIVFPPILLFVVAASVIGYLTLYRIRFSFKEIMGGELGIFTLVGPLLACGYEFSLSRQVSTETVFFGCVWGWLSLFPIHLRNLESIVSQSQARLRNLVNRFGFDRGKKFINSWWLIGFAGLLLFHFVYDRPFWFGIFAVVIGYLTFQFAKKLFQLSSPMGSEVAQLRRRGAYLVDTVMIIWVLEILWNLVA